MRAPLNSNTQPWHTVFTSGAARDRLVAALLHAARSSGPNIAALPEAFTHLRDDRAASLRSAAPTSTIQSATGRATAVPRGRGAGGSTAINAMIFARGHRASYAAWQDAGAKGWNFDALLPVASRP